MQYNLAATTRKYTEKEEELIHAQWKQNPTRDVLKALATTLGRSEHAILMKLTKDGLYTRQKRIRKTRSKDEVVAEVQEWLGMELDSLSAMTRQDLLKLLQFIKEF